MNHYQKNKQRSTEPSLTVAFNNVLKISSLIFLGFGFGATMTLTKTVLDDVQLQETDGRKLSAMASSRLDESNYPQPVLRGPLGSGGIGSSSAQPGYRYPSSLPEPVRDGNNGGQRYVYPAEKESLQQRLKLVENHLHSQQRQRQIQEQQQPQPVVTHDYVKATELQMVDNNNNNNRRPRTMQDIEFCRQKVFVTQVAGVTEDLLDISCNRPSAKRFQVCHDLADFTGLTMQEVIVRMARLDRFHFEEEHMFWNPQTATELAWYYSTSQSYLFANAIHPPRTGILDRLQKDVHEPVLDYSGGVGNTVLYLAMDRGFRCQYFGIGMIEKAFAQFRVAKRGLQHMVTFLHPWSQGTDWKFDPIRGALPRDGSLGAILAIDVLEHIPEYHVVVAAMVESLKVGGVLVERTPFADHPVVNGQEVTVDTRIHVHNGGITMAEAMGDKMVYREVQGYWEKIKA